MSPLCPPSPRWALAELFPAGTGLFLLELAALTAHPTWARKRCPHQQQRLGWSLHTSPFPFCSGCVAACQGMVATLPSRDFLFILFCSGFVFFAEIRCLLCVWEVLQLLLARFFLPLSRICSFLAKAFALLGLGA